MILKVIIKSTLGLGLLLLILSCKKHETTPVQNPFTTSFSVNGNSIVSYTNPSGINTLRITCPNDTATNQITYTHDIINYDTNYPTSAYTLSIPYDSSNFVSLLKTNTKYPLLANVGDSCSIGMDFTYNDVQGIPYSSISDNNLSQQYVSLSKITYLGDEESAAISYAVYSLSGNFTCIVQSGDTSLPLKVISNGNFTVKAYLLRQ